MRAWRQINQTQTSADLPVEAGDTVNAPMSRDLIGNLHTVVVGKDGLMRFHDRERILSYCRSCEKFGAFWSCPPFETPPLVAFPEWSHAVIVCLKTGVKPGTTKDQLIARFLDSRVHFGALMRRMEARCAQATALVAGHCSGCETCTRTKGKACRTPERLRYSLEAVGFDVTGLAEGLVKQKVHWPKTGLPNYLTTVGALLCPNQTSAEDVCTAARGGFA